ncbi:unnamed protein product [Chondrus crispus]|uniref:Uncharacterized protein n=1 Tax=Chondrus crispus TaxID=2769 RepID=R7QA69_CHOCR|nr:unnamed protein product [Chondrus crispus]CDF34365.1 unnamed protein product [Chondrus crispus]|eukprot:XP_005714184.1 unnamed protein product [Chondrus crispus]
MGNMPDKASEKRKPRTFEEVSKTFGGTGPAVIAFILESVYNLQILSGVQPGAEFYEAIRREGPWKIVCGDAPARDTIQNLYGVFGNPLRSLRDSLSSIEEIVGRLILPPKDGVTMLGLFLLEPRRVLELVRLTFPALVISSAISLAGNAGALALDSAPSIPISMLSEGYATTLLPIVASLGQTLTMSYIIVSTLRFMKVLIADRDRFLTKSILETASEIQSTHERPVVICAVVGLLHVNGIVRQIQGQSEADALAS